MTGDTPRNDDDELLARAVRGAARHAAPSPQSRERIHAAVQAEWRAAIAVDTDGPELAAPSRAALRRRRWPLALAASVAVALLGAGLAWQARQAPAASVASIEMVRGVVQVEHPSLFGARRETLLARNGVAPGDTVATAADAGALLRFGPALTVRVAPGSRLSIDAAGRVTLAAGRVYVDADSQRGRQPLDVATRFGVVSHLGTQYAVATDGERLEVAVREGLVAIAPAAGRVEALQAHAGELLHLDAAGVPRREALGRADARWGWLAALPAPFDTDGATLAGFLEWYTRETGREVRFAAAADAARAGDVLLSGSIAGLAPDEALRTVAASSGLGARLDGERVVLALP